MTTLHYNTVSAEMRHVLQVLMQMPELSHFRLVGGTALSLLLGHRRSVDLDLFTDKTTDFQSIEQAILQRFPAARQLTKTTMGQTWNIDHVKCDLFDWKVPFAFPPLEMDGLRIATVDDIAAFKLESFPDRRSEKDFRDLAEILLHRNFGEVLVTFRKRYPHVQTGVILPVLLSPELVVRDASLQMIREEAFGAAAARIQKTVKDHEQELAQAVGSQAESRDAYLRNLIERRKKS